MARARPFARPFQRRGAQAGLTLVEMLVALGIFAMVGTASVAVVGIALSGQAQLTAQTDALGAIERTRSLLRADLAQAVDRPVREGPVGQERDVPAMAGGDAVPSAPGEEALGTLLLTLTRGGWDNPGDARPRAELQRVEYRVRDGQFLRRTRPFLDATAQTPHTEQILLTGIEAAEAAFWDGQAWRPGFASEDSAAFPPAVRIVLDHPAYGTITNDFLVGPRG